MTYDYSKYEWQIGTEVIGKSKDIDVTCVGAIHNIFEDDGNIYYAVCSSLFLAEELKRL
tara:strand:- start:916 stop:1092 length:177 start_codon:yes stop_codon:yes gene_type:complete